jgi:hypothetical protein
MTGVIILLVGWGITEGLTGKSYPISWPAELGKFIKGKLK